jgi:hypothetical protein
MAPPRLLVKAEDGPFSFSGSWEGGRRGKGRGEEDRKKGYRKREKGQEVVIEAGGGEREGEREKMERQTDVELSSVSTGEKNGRGHRTVNKVIMVRTGNYGKVNDRRS